jgi:UDP-GlcNAc:undecaprenyl-phosphate GlcNAc-1-phosphate transferase
MTYALTFFLALVISAIVTPVSMKLAGRWGAIAYPGGRHVHTKPIPRLGGLAIYAAFWSAALIMQV